jgi:hypothetical protein
MPRHEIEQLATELAEVLRAMDAGLRARFTETERLGPRMQRRETAARRRAARGGVAAATLRWFVGAMRRK